MARERMCWNCRECMCVCIDLSILPWCGGRGVHGYVRTPHSSGRMVSSLTGYRVQLSVSLEETIPGSGPCAQTFFLKHVNIICIHFMLFHGDSWI